MDRKGGEKVCLLANRTSMNKHEGGWARTRRYPVWPENEASGDRQTLKRLGGTKSVFMDFP